LQQLLKQIKLPMIGHIGNFVGQNYESIFIHTSYNIDQMQPPYKLQHQDFFQYFTHFS